MENDFGSFEGLQSFETGGVEDSNSNNGNSFSSFGQDSAPSNEAKSEPTVEANNLEDYGMQVVKQLSANGIAPTPYNYRVFFEKLLENKSQQFKNDAFQHIEFDQRPTEKQALLEAKVIKAQSYMVNAVQQIGAIVKNIRLLQGLLEKHKAGIEAASNPIVLQNIISIFGQELNKINELVGHQIQDAKNIYDKTMLAIEAINDEVICNSVYGVYNKRFLERRIGAEIEFVSDEKYKSSLILVRTAKSLDKHVNSEKTALMINKSISKILQKVANRSDVVAYYEAGIFGVLLSHSDKESAKRFANRLIEKVVGTSIIIGDDEISLNVCTGIVEISNNSRQREVIKNGLDALKKASNNNVSFVVYGEN